MRRYITRRFLLIIPAFIFVTMIVFLLLRLMPGDVLMAKIEQGMTAGQADLDVLRAELGIDRPIYVQYADFMWGVLRGDLGKSLWGGTESVTSLIFKRLPVTLELAVFAIVISLLIALPVGIISAIRQDSPLDYLLRSVAIGGLSIPNFWFATLIIVFPAIWFNWLPPLRYEAFVDNPVGNIRQFILPALVLGMALSASVMRITRTMMLEVLRQDYIRTAWAKGLGEAVVIRRHALKNALIPVVTILGNQVAFLVGGTVIIESIFALPGMGTLLIRSIQLYDWPVVQGINLFFTGWVLLVNLVVDMSYAMLDPRVRYS
jgi:peptide/nickel transport system permease protein